MSRAAIPLADVAPVLDCLAELVAADMLREQAQTVEASQNVPQHVRGRDLLGPAENQALVADCRPMGTSAMQICVQGLPEGPE